MLRAPFAILIDSLSYLVSALFVFLIRRPEPPVVPHDAAADGPKPSMRQEIAVGLRYVTGPPLAALHRRDDRDLELLRQRRWARS